MIKHEIIVIKKCYLARRTRNIKHWIYTLFKDVIKINNLSEQKIN